MPAPEQFERNQKAVIWPRVRFNSRGEPVVGAPYQADVRWELVRMESADARGARISVDGFLVPDHAVPEGSLVYLGTLEHWYGVGSGSQPSGAALLYRVETYDHMPDVKGRVIRRECGLRRFRGALPEGV